MTFGIKAPWATSVLVVEDDAELRRTIHNSLLMRGFFVEAAPDEREAARLLATLQRDVIVTDHERLAILREGSNDENASAVVLVDDGSWVACDADSAYRRFDSQGLANRVEEAAARGRSISRRESARC